MNTESASGDVADTAKQIQCQQLESVRRSFDNDNQAIEAVACTNLVQATIAVHSDSACSRRIDHQKHDEPLLLQPRDTDAVLA